MPQSETPFDPRAEADRHVRKTHVALDTVRDLQRAAESAMDDEGDRAMPAIDAAIHDAWMEGFVAGERAMRERAAMELEAQAHSDALEFERRGMGKEIIASVNRAARWDALRIRALPLSGEKGGGDVSE